MKTEKLQSDLSELITELLAFSQFLQDLSVAIRKDDRLALIIVCAGVELVLNYCIKKLCKHGSKLSENRSFMTKVYILDELKVIDDKILNNLTNLKDLRDTAAHHPEKELDWKDKFAFDKESAAYKQAVKAYGEPEDLVGYLYCVWDTFCHVAIGGHVKKKLYKIIDAIAIAKDEPNNKQIGTAIGRMVR